MQKIYLKSCDVIIMSIFASAVKITDYFESVMHLSTILHLTKSPLQILGYFIYDFLSPSKFTYDVRKNEQKFNSGREQHFLNIFRNRFSCISASAAGHQKLLNA